MNHQLQLLQKVTNKSERRILGLMSGTSLDGLDLALCKISGSGLQTELQLEFFKTISYPEIFKAELRSVFAQKQVSLEKLTLLNAYIGNYHADLVVETLKSWGVAPEEVDVIASHGQTVYHAPKHFHQQAGYPNATLQIGDGDHLAYKTGILTLSDFRQKHTAIGGEGAPLAIYGDYILLSSNVENRILLNLGGIANFTFLPQNNKPDQVVSSDVGPANTLIDAAVMEYYQQEYDAGGVLAESGKVNQEYLQALSKHSFLSKSLPKSTGPEMFSWNWAKQLLHDLRLNLASEDVLATLSQFTVNGIAEPIKKQFNLPNTSLYVSGGGLHNTFLMKKLQEALTEINCQPLEVLGISADAKEAILFAVLANETLFGEPIAFAGLPAVSLGKLCFPT